MESTMLPGRNETIFISHGDSLEDAEYLANLVRERTGVQDIVINYVGPVIGAHSGPGTIALFFWGSERESTDKKTAGKCIPPFLFSVLLYFIHNDSLQTVMLYAIIC